MKITIYTNGSGTNDRVVIRGQCGMVHHLLYAGPAPVTVQTLCDVLNHLNGLRVASVTERTDLTDHQLDLV